MIARMFYLAGLSFNLARNLYFQSAFTFAANHNIAGYLPSGYNLLRTTLLQKENANIDRLCAPIRSMWNEKGVSIVSDGWSDSQRRPLINFMAVVDGDPMFLKSVDYSGETKDMHFIFTLLKEVNNEVGGDFWWDSIDYIPSFTAPIYDMLRLCDTDKPCLHLVYDMWDTMIEKVKKAIYFKESKLADKESPLYQVVHSILVDRWNKNNTPLHCLAHALNP
ncbi:DUF659 domain-containing protein [Cephalotus follicularis]|uniref:DUF659 domain-containing protein n=1 Tax=Cephalotus follicularis TaxID=3775 RepID=A0A1Q3ATZ0_CEPFO|nr:DUF659 domain-containing protein [Cephalotus follicularis]